MIEEELQQLDSFMFCLKKAIESYNITYPLEYLYGITGFGARFTLSMNIKQGKYIGHPTSEYIWDILSVVELCFTPIKISCNVFIDGGYLTSARKTSVNKHEIPSFIKIIDSNPIIGPVIYPTVSGQWVYIDNGSQIDPNSINVEGYPFGRVFLQIAKVEELKPLDFFPASSLSYIIRTQERGEEPMEIAGKGDYSALSGWKAFARWMQAFSLPMRDVKHEYLDVLGKQVMIRRQFYASYWRILANNLKNPKEFEFAQRLSNCYDEIAKFAVTVSENQNYKNVKELYYLEQKTLPIYKEISHYLA